MAYKPKYYIYWDSCVFISWMEEHPERYETIRALLRQTAEKQGKFLTSAISITEVAYIEQEKSKRALDASAEEKMEKLWADPTIHFVEASSYLMRQARKLIRKAIPSGYALKPADAIHLATAQWVNQRSPTQVTEFHTYDDGLEKYGTAIGMTICKPWVESHQPPLHDDLAL